MIPFLDVRASYFELKQEITEAINQVLEGGEYILGPRVEAFEASFANSWGSKYCVGVGTGLDALRLALLAQDIGQGDEVVVPAHTFIATWLAVTQTGAIPIPVESDLSTYNMGPEVLSNAITRRTKAVIPVHLYGFPADLEGIRRVADKHGLYVLQDAAQAHGIRADSTNLSEVDAAWSFYPTKNLGCFGDAGAVTTNSKKTRDILRKLRNYGSENKYKHEILGINSRLDPLQASILSVKLKKLDEWNARRANIATAYSDAFKKLSVTLPPTSKEARPTWHLYVIRTPLRDRLREFLDSRGIGSGIHYPVPPHLQDAYRSLGFTAGSFPIAERIAREVISLPMGPHLSDLQVEEVIGAIDDFHSLSGVTQHRVKG